MDGHSAGHNLGRQLLVLLNKLLRAREKALGRWGTAIQPSPEGPSDTKSHDGAVEKVALGVVQVAGFELKRRKVG